MIFVDFEFTSVAVFFFCLVVLLSFLFFTAFLPKIHFQIEDSCVVTDKHGAFYTSEMNAHSKQKKKQRERASECSVFLLLLKMQVKHITGLISINRLTVTAPARFKTMSIYALYNIKPFRMLKSDFCSYEIN